MDKLKKARNEINRIDRKMAKLFQNRMMKVKHIAQYKNEHGLEIFDEKRECEVIRLNSAFITNEEIKPYYISFLKSNMDIAKSYQKNIIAKYNNESEEQNEESFPDLVPCFEKLSVKTDNGDYIVAIGKHLADSAAEIFDVDRKVLIVTDSGVPKEEVEKFKKQFPCSICVCVNEGEESKSLSEYERICKTLMDNNFTRKDCIVSFGGGVVGDLSGFAAATYMRGIDFYNVPTTLLAQADASVGGKTALNFGEVKNLIGAFYQPKGVIVDPCLLKSLDKRHIASGFAEIIKMALCFDKELFDFIESHYTDKSYLSENIEYILTKAISIKKNVVEADEKEKGVRKALNFGHTIAHSIELTEKKNPLYHGECVALGMLAMCSADIKNRLIPIYISLGLPTQYKGNPTSLLNNAIHDKKMGENGLISVVRVGKIGEFIFDDWSMDKLKAVLEENYI